jgi:hypothetical protein
MSDTVARRGRVRHHPDYAQPGPFLGSTDPGPYVEGTLDWDPETIAVTLAAGDIAAGLDARFQTTLERIENLRIPYNLLGPNSNTVVRTLLETSGLPVAQPVALAPGFDHPSLL